MVNYVKNKLIIYFRTTNMWIKSYTAV